MPILPRTSVRPAPSLTAKNWSPVSYTTQVSGLSAGETLMMPQATLQSGFNTPYLVDEIRLTAYTTTAQADMTATQQALSAVIRYQLQTGSFFFSQGALSSPSAVPMMLYSPTYSGSGFWEDTFQNIGATTARIQSTRRWCLPKPLWMPPGDIIQATVSREVTYGSTYNDVTAQLTVVGRALPPNSPKPATRCVPHIGWFLHPLGDVYSAANAQFKNPFRVPWYVQRIVANTRSNAGTNTAQTGFGLYEDPSGGTQYVRVRIADSLGYKVTGSSLGDFVPLGDIAAAVNDASWTFGRPIPPNENFNVDFQFVSGSSTNYTNLQPLISFVGYREEAS